MKFLILAFALIMGPAYAVELNFSFNVNSSGPSIYPCDAGIRHVTHTDEVCYDRTTQDSCDPTSCEAGEECDCICTSGSGSGDTDFSQDFLTVTHADWADNGSPVPPTTMTTVEAADVDFARIFTDKNEWNKQISALTFNLASERYGAEFYLDVCYRGPQIDFEGNPSVNKHRMKLQSTITDLVSVNGLRYSELSDLKVKITATCDLQREGDYTGPANDDALAHQIMGVSGGDKNFSTSYAAFNAGANAFLLNDWINTANNKTPRFCKIRYSFLENVRNNTANPLATIRKWQKQQARISTFSDIANRSEL